MWLFSAFHKLQLLMSGVCLVKTPICLPDLKKNVIYVNDFSDERTKLKAIFRFVGRVPSSR
jgi:hypothetical protein